MAPRLKPISPPGPRSLQDAIKSLIVNPRYSDVVIKCGSMQWRVHKSVVCTQSKFFEMACDRDWKEAKTGIIELEEDDGFVIGQMIQFLYRSDYEDYGNSHGPIRFNVLMYIVADKYDIPDLATLATSKFNDSVRRFDDEQDFFLGVQELFQSAPLSASALRDKAIEVAIENSHELLFPLATHHDDPHERLNFQGLLREIPDFGEQVIIGISKSSAPASPFNRSVERLRCDNCYSDFNITMHKDKEKACVVCPFCKKERTRSRRYSLYL